MRIQVRLFAELRELLGSEALHLEVSEGATVAEALTLLRREHQALAGHSFVAAVNERYVESDQLLAELDELALIPPVSGG